MDSMSDHVAEVSIIVPTFNRLAYLQRCLASLLRLDYRAFEIIIVDDYSTDGTQAYLDQLNDKRVVVIHNTTNQGVAAARNIGVRQARYSLLAFTDDDCVVTPNWLTALSAGFNDPDVDWVFGRTSYISDHYRGYFPERLVSNGGGRWPGGGNIAYRRNVFIDSGGFDPFFVQYNNEDTELAVRLVARGHRFARIPQAIVYHQAMRWTSASLLRSSRNGSVWPVLKRRYPEHYREFSPDILAGLVVAPRDYIFIVLLPMVIPLLLIRYVMHGQRSLGIFFMKWPVWLILRRLWVYREAWRQRMFMM